MMKRASRIILCCLLLLITVSSVGCHFGVIACRRCRVVVVGNVCDRETHTRLKGVQILRRNEFNRERLELLGTQEEERFRVEQRRWVCSYRSHLASLVGRSHFRQHPLWVRLDILKEGYAPQDVYMNVFKHAQSDDAQEVTIDLGTVFLDRVPSGADPK